MIAPKKYIRKDSSILAVKIDSDWRQVLIQQGFEDPKIGDYYIDNCESCFSIMSKDNFERLFVEDKYES